MLVVYYFFNINNEGEMFKIYKDIFFKLVIFKFGYILDVFMKFVKKFRYEVIFWDLWIRFFVLSIGIYI